MKYKQELLSAIILSLITFIYALMIRQLLINTQSIANNIQNNFAYMFILSIFLFRLLYQKHDSYIILYKFDSLNEYILFEIKEKMKSIIIFFFIYTCLQIIVFSLIDPLFNIYVLIYHHFIYIWLMLLICSVLVISGQKKYLRRYIILFVLWNSLYMLYTLLQDSLFAQLTPFIILTNINIFEFARLIILSIMILLYVSINKGTIIHEE